MKESKVRKIRTYGRVVLALTIVGIIISIIIPLSTNVSKVLALFAGILQVIDIILSVVFIKELKISDSDKGDYVLKSPVRYILGSLIIVTILIILVILFI